MHVIGHQHKGVQFALVLAKCFAQPVQIGGVVFLGKEARLAIVPALYDVQWNAIKMDAGAAGYGRMLTREILSLAPLPLIAVGRVERERAADGGAAGDRGAAHFAQLAGALVAGAAVGVGIMAPDGDEGWCSVGTGDAEEIAEGVLGGACRPLLPRRQEAKPHRR